MSKQKKTVSRRASPTSTLLRAYRFNSELITRFEADCSRYLRNSRSVVEALMHHWLSTTPEERDAIAARYQDSIGSSKKRARP